MAKSAIDVNEELRTVLRDLGSAIRSRRKTLKLSAVVTAESAGISRITLHRIERGEPSVAMGAYVTAAAALGMGLHLSNECRPLARVPTPISV